jgi:N-formylglutamate amidohydrolase
MISAIPYHLILPELAEVPIVLSIPHCGTAIPEELSGHYAAELVAAPDDTDWYLDRLYDFAPGLGITMIYARYSRWVIDLNRVPDGKPLYNDGRLITELCPTTDFMGRPIYSAPQFEPDDAEKERRIREYYRPYHHRIDSLIADLRSRFEKVIFWDGHSIRRRVESISPEPFPDLILGNNDGQTASREIVGTAESALREGPYGLSSNHPFKGGYLTRSKGDPANGVHALQLEMSKDLYMDPSETEYDEQKAARLASHLKTVFERLIELVTDEASR